MFEFLRNLKGFISVLLFVLVSSCMFCAYNTLVRNTKALNHDFISCMRFVNLLVFHSFISLVTASWLVDLAVPLCCNIYNDECWLRLPLFNGRALDHLPVTCHIYFQSIVMLTHRCLLSHSVPSACSTTMRMCLSLVDYHTKCRKFTSL